MRILTRGFLVALIVALSSSIALAQAWRGMGRLAGKVTDESGTPIEGVMVKLSLHGQGGTETKTNKKGEWAVAGLARGPWDIDFEKEMYEARRITVAVNELSRLPPIEIVLKMDLNEVVRVEVEKAASLARERKWPEARTVYEGIMARFPAMAVRVEPFLAQTYYAEKKLDEAILHLKNAVQLDPADQTNKMLLANVLMEAGRFEEGREVMATVDDSMIQDPAVYVNIGINLLNQNRPDDALPYFEKAVTRFPDKGDGYYYRALIRLQKGDTEGTRTDLAKFLELSPNAPEAPAARKALEQLKK
ncbi:MAG: tetratricopeptide repeat protein [Acidobacteriota bacterium]